MLRDPGAQNAADRMRRPQGAKLGTRRVPGARQCALMQRDVTVGVDQARQDELASRIDHLVVGGFRLHRSAGMTEMADPGSLDEDQGIRDRFAARPTDQGSVFDQKPRLPIHHSSLLHCADLAPL